MVIDRGMIDIGVDSTRFVPGDTDSLLRSYLMMVRRTRDQRRAVTITLRREDIEVVAEYLGQTSEMVLGRLADLMGSTQTQRAAMLTLLATGAMLIAVTGSVAAEAPHSTAHAAFVSGPAAAVELVDQYRAATSDHAESAARSEVRPASGNPAAGFGEQLRVTDGRSSAGTPVQGDGSEVGVIEGDKGERILVAVGLPPVPPGFGQPADEPPIDTTQLAETLEQAAAAHAESESATGTTDDGSTVAVGLPPIPPPNPGDAPTTDTETGITDDGSTVAVGLPPIPPPPNPGD